MNGVKNAFSHVPVFHEQEPTLPGNKILLRNSVELTAYRIAMLRVKKAETGFLVLAEWMEVATKDSFFPGSHMFYALYLTEAGINAISPTDWSKIPSDLKEAPLIELWFDPRD